MPAKDRVEGINAFPFYFAISRIFLFSFYIMREWIFSIHFICIAYIVRLIIARKSTRDSLSTKWIISSKVIFNADSRETRVAACVCARNSCVFQIFFVFLPGRKKDSFYHLDRGVHYCVKSDRMTSSRGGQFWPIAWNFDRCTKNERDGQRSSLEQKHHRAAYRRAIKSGVKKEIDSAIARYRRNFISRNIDRKDIMRFCSRCCRTRSESDRAVDVDARCVIQSLKGR